MSILWIDMTNNEDPILGEEVIVELYPIVKNKNKYMVGIFKSKKIESDRIPFDNQQEKELLTNINRKAFSFFTNGHFIAIEKIWRYRYINPAIEADYISKNFVLKSEYENIVNVQSSIINDLNSQIKRLENINDKLNKLLEYKNEI